MGEVLVFSAVFAMAATALSVWLFAPDLPVFVLDPDDMPVGPIVAGGELR